MGVQRLECNTPLTFLGVSDTYSFRGVICLELRNELGKTERKKDIVRAVWITKENKFIRRAYSEGVERAASPGITLLPPRYSQT